MSGAEGEPVLSVEGGEAESSFLFMAEHSLDGFVAETAGVIKEENGLLRRQDLAGRHRAERHLVHRSLAASVHRGN